MKVLVNNDFKFSSNFKLIFYLFQNILKINELYYKVWLTSEKVMWKGGGLNSAFSQKMIKTLTSIVKRPKYKRRFTIERKQLYSFTIPIEDYAFPTFSLPLLLLKIHKTQIIVAHTFTPVIWCFKHLLCFLLVTGATFSAI